MTSQRYESIGVRKAKFSSIEAECPTWMPRLYPFYDYRYEIIETYLSLFLHTIQVLTKSVGMLVYSLVPFYRYAGGDTPVVSVYNIHGGAWAVETVLLF